MKTRAKVVKSVERTGTAVWITTKTMTRLKAIRRQVGFPTIGAVVEALLASSRPQAVIDQRVRQLTGRRKGHA